MPPKTKSPKRAGKKDVTVSRKGRIHADVLCERCVLPVMLNVFEAVAFIAAGNEEWGLVGSKAIRQLHDCLTLLGEVPESSLYPFPRVPIVPKPLSGVRVVLLYGPPPSLNKDIPRRWIEALEPFANGAEVENVNFNLVPGALFLQVPMYQHLVNGETRGMEYVCARFIEDLVVHMFETCPRLVWVFMNPGAERYLSNHTQMLSFKDKPTVSLKTQVSNSRLLVETDRLLASVEKKQDVKHARAIKSRNKLPVYHADMVWKFASC